MVGKGQFLKLVSALWERTMLPNSQLIKGSRNIIEDDFPSNVVSKSRILIVTQCNWPVWYHNISLLTYLSAKKQTWRSREDRYAQDYLSLTCHDMSHLQTEKTCCKPQSICLCMGFCIFCVLIPKVTTSSSFRQVSFSKCLNLISKQLLSPSLISPKAFNPTYSRWKTPGKSSFMKLERLQLFHGEIAVHFVHPSKFSWRISRDNCGNNILSFAPGGCVNIIWLLGGTRAISAISNLHHSTALKHASIFHQHSLMEEISKSYTSWSLTILMWKTSVFGFDTASQVVSRISINFRSINSRERSAPKNLLNFVGRCLTIRSPRRLTDM